MLNTVAVNVNFCPNFHIVIEKNNLVQLNRIIVHTRNTNFMIADFMLDAAPLSSCQTRKTDDVMNSDPVFPPGM